MGNILLALIGAIVGIAATIVVARYYFIRSTDKRLTPYIQFASSILTRIDPDVRKVLKVYYKDVEVTDLFQLQILVANDGERAIRDCIEPFTIRLPGDVQVLDATLLHVQPTDREVKVKTHNAVKPSGETNVECQFPLLNKGEFFLLKLLLKGSLDPSKLEFRITADDLPPVIKAQRLPFTLVAGSEDRIEWHAVAIGVVFLILSLASALSTYVMYATRFEVSYFFPFSRGSILPGLSTYAVIILCGLSTLLLFSLAIILIAGIGFESVYRRRPRFDLPSHLYHRPIFMLPDGSVKFDEKIEEKQIESYGSVAGKK